MRRAAGRRRKTKPLTPERRKAIIAQGLVYAREEFPGNSPDLHIDVVAGRLGISTIEVSLIAKGKPS